MFSVFVFSCFDDDDDDDDDCDYDKDDGIFSIFFIVVCCVIFLDRFLSSMIMMMMLWYDAWYRNRYFFFADPKKISSFRFSWFFLHVCRIGTLCVCAWVTKRSSFDDHHHRIGLVDFFNFFFAQPFHWFLFFVFNVKWLFFRWSTIMEQKMALILIKNIALASPTLKNNNKE